MIKVNELRIGNFVFDDEGIIAKVVGFKPYEHSVRCDEEEGCDILVDLYPQDGKIRKGYAIDSPSANPIPLTPERLIRCGFEDKSAMNRDSGEIDWLEHSDMPGITFRHGEFYQYPHIKCLHQLQNLFFDLTGKELKIELWPITSG